MAAAVATFLTFFFNKTYRKYNPLQFIKLDQSNEKQLRYSQKCIQKIILEINQKVAEQKKVKSEQK